MQKKIIIDMIKAYKMNNSGMMDIIQKMQPLINSYAKKMYKLEYEDMQQEFAIAIIESIMKMKKIENENQCLAYISNAVKNRYLELCRKSLSLESEILYASENLEYFSVEGENTFADVEFFADVERIEKTTSDLKEKIAKYAIEEMSDYEIAKLLGVSRQYINRCKKDIFSALIKKK